MTPAQPPLPTAWYLPFHSSGIQTSTLMSESEEGVSVAAMRQYAGSASGGAAGPPRPAGAAAGAAAAGPAPRPAGAPAGAGATNGPAGTTCASVMVTFGNDNDFKSAHGVAANAEVAVARAATSRNTACLISCLF